jgi:hypothetical protein
MAHVASASARLIIAGPRVTWDWLPLLGAVLTLQAALIYWWFQWSLRDQPVALIDLAFRAIACLLLYMQAFSVLPEDSRGRPNLRQNFERSSPLFFGTYGGYVLMVGILPWGYKILTEARLLPLPWENLLTVAACLLAMVWRRRWLQALLITSQILGLHVQWMSNVIRG